jgi:hypothetical protein
MSNNRTRPQDDATRQRIMDAINAANDEGQRAILLLLLEISGKIDAVLSDERGLRELVLNGSNAMHDEDHQFIATLRAQGGLLDQAASIIKERHTHGGHCAWAAAKQAEEKANHDEKRKMAWDWFGKVIWGVTLLTAGAIGSKYFGV